jgi:SP family arabinose:H+ symporter-like MFS transporter
MNDNVKKASIHSNPGGSGWTMYAFLIAFVAAVGGFLFGYDLSIASGAQKFLRINFDLDSNQLGFAMSSAILGCMAGPIAGLWLCDRIGRRNSLIFAAILFGISAIGTALPDTIFQFNMFRIIGGVGLGLASVASPMYIAEISPKAIRGRLVTMNQLAIVVGALISIFVAYFLAKYLNETDSWRWMFASEIVPIIAFVIFLLILPETPRWLAENRQPDKARQVLRKITSPENAEIEMQGIEEEMAREDPGAGVSWVELFRPGLKVALLLGIVLSLISQWTGWSMIAFYMPTIYEKAGIVDAAEALKWTIIPNIASLFFTLIAIYLVDLLGRRPLYLFFAPAMAVATTLLGLVFIFKIQGWPVVVVLCLCAAPHAIALGALSWLVVSEIFPTRIRAKAMSLCTIALWLACFISTYMVPRLFDISEKLFNHPSGVFFLCSVICLISFMYLLKYLPETKGRSLEEIAKSWTK